MNERNADVSKTLTEQWKKGELLDGWYYTEIDLYDNEDCIEIIPNIYNDCFEYGVIKQVFAPVPSYEQWQELKEYERIVTSYYMKPIDYETACETVNKLLEEKKELRQENTKLKKLLKEAEKVIWEVMDCREDREFYKDLADEYYTKRSKMK